MTKKLFVNKKFNCINNKIPPTILAIFPYFVENPVNCIVLTAIKNTIKSSSKKNNIYKAIYKVSSTRVKLFIDKIELNITGSPAEQANSTILTEQAKTITPNIARK